MKWVTWIAKMSVAAVLFTMVSLYATWTAVQLVLDRVMAHYQLGQGMQKIEFSDFLAEFGKGLNIMKQPAAQDRTGNGGKSAPAAAGISEAARTDAGTAASSGAGLNGSTAPEDRGAEVSGGGTAGGRDDALPVWSQSQNSSSGGTASRLQEQSAGAGQLEKKTIVSTEALQFTKDNITGEDKMKLFSLLISKLPSDELQNISQLMEDGITQAELGEMEAIIRKHLTKEEFDQLIAILEKYQ